MRYLAILVCIILGLSLVFNSCTKVTYSSNSSEVLDFSKDTIHFDSVFTTIGSVMQYFTVINPHSEALLIDEISLEKGLDSQFRINIDGQAILVLDSNKLTTIDDVTILPGDSMFVFVEVTVDPTTDISPFLVEDNIRFKSHDNSVDQVVKLLAYGRNAEFHYQEGNWFNYNENLDNILSPNEYWTNDLPHVVYGQLRVMPGNSLTIEAGSEVYVHDGSGIWVQGGTLNIEGTLNNKVVIQGDRMDGNYPNEAGQWGLEFPLEFEHEGEFVYFTANRGGIWFDRAMNCNVNHAIIKNGTTGFWVDSVADGADYALNITNTEISNMTTIGMVSQGGHIKGVNNLFTDCGEACGAFSLGGDIVMHLSTFANYWASGGVRQGPSVYVNDWYESSGGEVYRPFSVTTEFKNCIIWGNNASLEDHDELVANLRYPNDYTSSLFTACALDVQDEDFPLNILSDNCTKDTEPPFVNTTLRDFHLSNNSSLWEGISSEPPFSISEVSTDLDGIPRSIDYPDRGCYERN